MKKINKIVTLSIAWVLFASVSFADTLIGAKLSYGHLKASGNNKVSATGSNSGSTTTGDETANFPYASLFVEHGFANGFSVGLDYIPFTAEIEAKSKSDSDLQSASTGTVTGTKKATANIKNHTSLYINTPKKNNFYGKIGYAYSQVTITDYSMLSGMSSIASSKDSMRGPMIGAGYEKELSNGLVLKTEVTYTDYSEVKFSGTTGSTVSADVKNLAAHIGIAKKF